MQSLYPLFLSTIAFKHFVPEKDTVLWGISWNNLRALNKQPCTPFKSLSLVAKKFSWCPCPVLTPRECNCASDFTCRHDSNSSTSDILFKVTVDIHCTILEKETDRGSKNYRCLVWLHRDDNTVSTEMGSMTMETERKTERQGIGWERVIEWYYWNPRFSQTHPHKWRKSPKKKIKKMLLVE